MYIDTYKYLNQWVNCLITHKGKIEDREWEKRIKQVPREDRMESRTQARN